MLVGASWTAIPGGHDSPKSATVADLRRKPALSADTPVTAGDKAHGDLCSAYLARCVHPEISLLDVGQAHRAWPGCEPTLQAAYQQAITN